MSKFQVGDEVLILADDKGLYGVEQSDVPLLRRAMIHQALDEDGDYRIRAEDGVISYANQTRIFPLDTIFVDGNPRFAGQSVISAEESFAHASDSDGGVNLNMSVGPIPERHYEWRDCECKRICNKKEDPTVGPNEDTYYDPNDGNYKKLEEPVVFTLEQVVALLNAFKSEV